MADEIKFTDEELKELTEVQQSVSDILIKFGQYHLQQITLDNSKKSLEEEYSNLVVKQSELAQRLNSKYGPGVVDPTTGVFTPQKN